MSIQLRTDQPFNDFDIERYARWTRNRWNYNKPFKKFTKRDDYIMATGLGGECGEVLEVLKKMERDKGKTKCPKKRKLVDEMGDLLYYFCVIARRKDITFEEIMTASLRKMNRRSKAREKNRNAK